MNPLLRNYNTNHNTSTVVSFFPSFFLQSYEASKLAPLLRLLSPRDGGLTQNTCHESAQTLSPEKAEKQLGCCDTVAI